MPAKPEREFDRFLRLYYAFHFCQSLCPVYAVYGVMFLAKGMSVGQVAGLIVVWTASTILFELPSGALADRAHRGRLLAISNAAKAAGFACWLLPPSFGIFAFGFVLWSVSGSLRSGTLQSLLYDTLRAHELTAQYEHVAGRGLFVGRVAQALAFAVGGPLAVAGYHWAIWASVLPLLLGSALALGFREERTTETTTQARSLIQQIRVAAAAARQSPTILRAALYSMCATATYGTLDEFGQVYCDWVGLPLIAFGLVGMAFSGAEALGGLLGSSIKRTAGAHAKFLLCLVAGAATLAAALQPSQLMIIAFGIPYLVIAAGALLNEADLQRAIDTAERATITSLDNLVANLSGLLSAAAFGIIASLWGNVSGFAMFALVFLAYGLWGLWDQRRRTESQPPPSTV